ncbi:MAG TPA: nucleotidyltransferase family protein [Acidimicrobiales bacterium]|nr:nucleotidyltransferase family protein [Acidimicrobiales bacterium]
MSIAAVILAAGEGSRFGAPGEKLLVSVRGRPLLAWAIEPARQAGLDELIVVSGAADLSDVLPDDVTLLRNEEWQQGQATSLGVALDWCQRQGHSSAVVGLGDTPGLTAAAWRRVAEAVGGPIVVATYGGRRGHPVRLDASVWTLLPTSGDEGARSLMSRRPELVVEVTCEGTATDIDTREDLRRWS